MVPHCGSVHWKPNPPFLCGIIRAYRIGLPAGSMRLIATSGNRFGNRSIPEFLGDRYQSEGIRVLVSLISLVFEFVLIFELLTIFDDMCPSPAHGFDDIIGESLIVACT